ncbi:cell envelope integrity/translocation protein TolA [Bradyrhizobium sp. BTAi1]|uniref:cell envelope integrity/translocation protein TolA n=1 Tax=Bradyrhizobium sp. (strain BTAi1 / ATCC BAA-1182) TaxID=288000 RepID=UPI00005DECB6|nr:cell envelope integrity/translocation protein TolA [Bradyrhizobium sp. BTAi1]
MMYDLTTFLFWILLAAVIGGFVGWYSWSDDKRPDWLRSWLLPATLAFGIGALLALLSVLPGRAGLWLEVALLMVSAYVLGCLSGGQLKEYVGLGDSSAMAPGGPGTSAAFTAAPAPPARPWADSPSPAVQAAASIEADRLAAEAAVKTEADRLAAEAAAKAEADRLAAEAAAKAEADRLAAEAAAKAEADRLAAEAAAKAEADRLAAEAAAKAEADRLAAEAAAKAEADRLAAEAAAKAEADRLAAEAAAKAKADRLAAEAAAKAEADRLAAEAAAKAEADRLAAEAAAKAEADRLAAEAAAKADADRLAAEAAAKAEEDRLAAEAAAKAEADRLAAEAAAKAEADRLAAEAAAAKAEADRLAAEAEADQLAAEVAASAPTTVTADDRPPALPAPDGTADDLKLIKGIGPKNERILNEIGVHHFSQIAAWSPGQASWVGDHMAFPGRIEREHWIAQAKLLAAGLDTAHSSAVKSGAITIDDTADAPLSGDEADALLAQLPDLAPAVENEDAHAGRRPLGLAAPRGGQADDLKLIKGIGKQNEARLHGLGIWHFAQIAAWTPDHAKWVGSYLAFAGRIEREQWIAQAEELASGGTTEFARRVEAGLVKSSLDDGSHGQDNIEIVQPRE